MTITELKTAIEVYGRIKVTYTPKTGYWSASVTSSFCNISGHQELSLKEALERLYCVLDKNKENLLLLKES